MTIGRTGWSKEWIPAWAGMTGRAYRVVEGMDSCLRRNDRNVGSAGLGFIFVFLTIFFRGHKLTRGCAAAKIYINYWHIMDYNKLALQNMLSFRKIFYKK